MADLSRRSFLVRTAGTGAALALAPAKKVVDKLIPYVIPEPRRVRACGISSRPPAANARPAAACRCDTSTAARSKPKATRTTRSTATRCARGANPASKASTIRTGSASARPRARRGVAAGGLGSRAIPAIGGRVRESRGRVALLSDLQTGALAELMRQFVRACGSDRICFYEPFNHEALRAAHAQVFGVAAIPDYRLESLTDYQLRRRFPRKPGSRPSSSRRPSRSRTPIPRGGKPAGLRRAPPVHDRRECR